MCGLPTCRLATLVTKDDMIELLIEQPWVQVHAMLASMGHHENSRRLQPLVEVPQHIKTTRPQDKKTNHTEQTHNLDQPNYEFDEAVSHNQELRDQIDVDEELILPEAASHGSFEEMIEEMGEQVRQPHE
jgi:hypothetical protein